MKQLILFILMLFAIAVGNAQPQQQTITGQQSALSELQSLWDSLSPRQKNSFFTEIKHIMDPEVTVIQPGEANSYPPSDAIILFDSKDINKEWEESTRGAEGVPGVKPAVTWVIKDGAMESSQGSGSLRTKRVFEDFQLHIEWKTP